MIGAKLEIILLKRRPQFSYKNYMRYCTGTFNKTSFIQSDYQLK